MDFWVKVRDFEGGVDVLLLAESGVLFLSGLRGNGGTWFILMKMSRQKVGPFSKSNAKH